MCERELETEQRQQHIDPHSYGRQRCVFLVLQGCSTGGPGAKLSVGWWLSLLHLITNWSPKQLGAPRAPSAGCGFPYNTSSNSVWSLTHQDPKGPLCRAFSTTSYQQLLWTPTVSLPVLTELYNSSTPTQSLEWHVWSSSSGSNCHAVQRSLSSAASVYECTMRILPCPISSAKSAHTISFDYWPLECVTFSRCITLELHVWPGRSSKYNIEFVKE